MLIGFAIILVWVLLVPLWQIFARFLNPNETIVDFSVRTVTLLFVPYVILSLNLVTGSVFYGLGRTRYMAYQSIIVHGTIYVAAFLAYMAGVWTSTCDTLMYLFASGIILDSILTLYFLQQVLTRGSGLRSIPATN
jgi:Na+-driven multidrug efflux pump